MTAEGFMVQVVCDDRSHEGRTVKIANFTYCDITKVLPDVYGDADPYMEWWFDLPATLDGEGYESPAPLPDPQQNMQAHEWRTGMWTALYDNQKAEWPTESTVDGRKRYSMQCNLCGLHVVAREEVIDPVLDKLAVNGVTSIELTHLAAIVA